MFTTSPQGPVSFVYFPSNESDDLIIHTDVLPARPKPEPGVSTPAPPTPAASWALPVPDGAYGPIPVWSSRELWLAQLAALLATPHGDQVRRRHRPATKTVLRVAAVDAAAADADTGRSVATAHATVARTLGLSSRHVQRAREVIAALGMAQTVVGGRYLTTAERDQATALHGKHQTRAASVRCLTTPQAVAKNVHLPRRALVKHLSAVKNYLPKRARAQKRAAARPEAVKNRKPRAKKPAPSPALTKMACELTEKMLFLGQWRTPSHSPAGSPRAARRIEAISRIIRTSNLDPNRYTAEDVADILTQLAAETGQVPLTGSYVRNPLGYLTTLLRRVCDYITTRGHTTRAERHQAALARRAELLAAQAAAREEADRARARANSPEALAARDAYYAQWPKKITPTRSFRTHHA